MKRKLKLEVILFIGILIFLLVNLFIACGKNQEASGTIYQADKYIEQYGG